MGLPPDAASLARSTLLHLVMLGESRHFYQGEGLAGSRAPKMLQGLKGLHCPMESFLMANWSPSDVGREPEALMSEHMDA